MKVKYFLTSSGRSPVEEFLEGLSLETKSDYLDAVILLEAGQSLSMPLSRNLSSIQNGIYFVHAIKKKSQELPQKEIDVVLKRLREV